MTENVSVSLNLLVLYAADLNATLAFYSALGLEFVQEKHGAGPVHYACKFGSLILELYPGTAGLLPDPKSAGTARLGFQVADLDAAFRALKQVGAEIVTPPRLSPSRRQAVVRDPDGRTVALVETFPGEA